MWFLTSLLVRGESIENPSLGVDTHRTFGFYKEHHDAVEAVIENRCNMHECLYNYLVLENFEEGIHPLATAEEWYRWDGRWVPCSKPTDLEHLISWALG